MNLIPVEAVTALVTLSFCLKMNSGSQKFTWRNYVKFSIFAFLFPYVMYYIGISCKTLLIVIQFPLNDSAESCQLYEEYFINFPYW